MTLYRLMTYWAPVTDYEPKYVLEYDSEPGRLASDATGRPVTFDSVDAAITFARERRARVLADQLILWKG